MRSEYRQLRVGLMGLGLETYWRQFEGLEQRLRGSMEQVERRIAAPSRLIVNLGLVDTPTKAIAAAHQCRREDVDILLVYATTYALSSTVLPVVRHAKVPVILLNLQPAAAIDYSKLNSMVSRAEMTGEWLAYCSACPIPEIANVLRRLGLPFFQITGTLEDDPVCWKQLHDWLRAAEVVHALAHGRLGLMGHYYGGMLDIAADLTQVSGRFGLHIEMIEVDELTALRREVSYEEIADMTAAFRDFFWIADHCADDQLRQAAQTAAALNRLVDRREIDVLAYYHKGVGVAENEETISSIILGASMLTGRGVPVAGEYEVKNAIAMKIMDLLGIGGSFTEYYAMDFAADVILMGHDGPGHVGIAEDKIKVRSLQVYHGKVGAGLSVEMSVRYGPVTLLSVVEDRDTGFMLLIAQGESVPGPILEIGNTNSRYKFSLGARGFAETWNSYGPAHHCAIGIGHAADLLQKVARLLGLNAIQIC